MPVPIPRQRVIPAVENGHDGGAAPRTDPPAGSPTEVTRGTAPGSTDATADATDTVTGPVDGPAGHQGATDGTDAGAASGPAAPTAAEAAEALARVAAGSAGSGPATSTALTLLVIEDDPAGSFAIPSLLDSAELTVRVRTARNLTEAERLLTDDVHCILLDLALPAPGARGGEPEGAGDELAVLRHVLRLAPRHAVLALTGAENSARGPEAVRVGAQDFLYRDELDGRLLSRAVRYAVERKRADQAQRQLTESRLRAQENARLERGLLPTPLLEGAPLRFAARYRPGRSRALLGGDFYDTVRTADGTVHAMIGDVCGHGPDEAALGVELRIAWRALTFAGLCGDELLSTLQRVLENERPDDEIFATLCTVDISPDGRSAGLCLAGHPSPLIARQGHLAELLPYDDNGPALGLLPRARWPRRQVELGRSWSLMLYTDGLIEGRVGAGNQRLGQDGMVSLVRDLLAEGLRGDALLDAAMTEVRALNGGELTDDVAVLLLDRMVPTTR
ncbi:MULTISPECIES: PP2C family protein-serine/threonine phosphatase [Streptomyces]|uniref:Magnesium or manganese-dependent protein phosphatase n=2 Tax=Streptomyces griseus group TaxID=629295 RepID=A0A380MLL7_STRGR|nr:fused response regulator/phosphatase [Streptomyces griseus]SUO93212.1 Magnesium or manganese-dependent protein phosphatase [Streptomyces griseus]